jgi:hypothetical protein
MDRAVPVARMPRFSFVASPCDFLGTGKRERGMAPEFVVQ